jgi:hypothetical protein
MPRNTEWISGVSLLVKQPARVIWELEWLIATQMITPMSRRNQEADSGWKLRIGLGG